MVLIIKNRQKLQLSNICATDNLLSICEQYFKCAMCTIYKISIANDTIDKNDVINRISLLPVDDTSKLGEIIKKVE